MPAPCFAIETKRAHELAAAIELRRNPDGIVDDVWVPQMWGRRHWHGAVVPVTTPIFPGYIFAWLELDDFRWHAINRTRGVRQMLQFGTLRPTPIAERAIADLRRRFGADAIDERDIDGAMRDLLPGDTVEVLVGPFAGFSGTVAEWTPARRVKALVAIFGRQTPVEFDEGDVRKVEE